MSTYTEIRDGFAHVVRWEKAENEKYFVYQQHENSIAHTLFFFFFKDHQKILLLFRRPTHLHQEKKQILTLMSENGQMQACFSSLL